MTRYEWRTIREAEMNEMRQRQIKLGKIRKQGRDKALCGFISLLFAGGMVALAQFTDFADTGLVLIAILAGIPGVVEIVNGIKKWTL